MSIVLLALALSWLQIPPHAAPRAAAATPPSVTIDFVGDVMLGGGVADLVAARGPSAPFKHVMPLLSRADAVVGNLECALSLRGTPTSAKKPEALKKRKEFLLRGTPASADGLRHAGFAAMGVANNHTMDFGPDAFADTLLALRGRGIASAGGGSNFDEAWAPAFFERRGLRFALLSFSDIVPRGYAATRSTPGIAVGRSMATTNIDDAAIAAMSAAVRSAARSADIVIVYEHWGEEFVSAPAPEQIRAAHALVDAGARFVIGAHPHVLGPIEPYHGGLIAYSLGNFVFDAYPGPTARSEVLEVRVTRGGVAAWRTVAARIVYGAPYLVEEISTR